MQKGTDLRRHIREQEKQHPGATGQFTQLLGQIALSAKIVSRAVNRAGLVDLLGKSGEENVYGEEKAQLDVYANRIFKKNLSNHPGVSLIASEEEKEAVESGEGGNGKYVVTMDPLDGSSNIDYNVSIGSIFGIFQKRSGAEEPPTVETDLLQKGRNFVASGYVIYGSSTMLVYSAGEEVFGFTLDRSIGEFLLSHPSIKTPDAGGSYSVNESYFQKWEKPIQESVRTFKNDSNYSSRYIGSLVADFHRNLLNGGVFLYPNEPETPGKEQGKLRLLFEAAPLGYIIEQAGGLASNGSERILKLKPKEIHQRIPLYLGSRKPVKKIEENVARSVNSVVTG